MMSNSRLPQLGVVGAGTLLAGQFLGIVFLAFGTALVVWLILTRKKGQTK
jgi:hypothetical protein